tara:strand:- start:1449 stop:2087 length:639 start_codon:yes stop_codon:yes gene_type:complete
MPKETKEKKDLSMTDEKWNTRIARIETWLDAPENADFLSSTEDIEDAVDLIRMNIKRGNRTADKRKNLWNQILIEGRDFTVDNGAGLDWPVAVGKESNLPTHVQASLKSLDTQVQDIYTAFWNDNPLIQQIVVISDRNKEMGGSPHPNAEEFAKGRGLAVKQRFTKYFNENRWNGELNIEEGFGISPPPADVNADAENADAQETDGDSSDDS